MKNFIWKNLAFILGFVFLVLISVLLFNAYPNTHSSYPFPSKKDDCPSIPEYNATGSIRCWTNNYLIYDKPSYYNGVILCSFDGYEVKLNKSNLCIVESNQLDIWSPPI